VSRVRLRGRSEHTLGPTQQRLRLWLLRFTPMRMPHEHRHTAIVGALRRLWAASVPLVRDGPLRRTLKRAALAWFSLTLAVDRALARATGRSPYVLGGNCRTCAACCEHPSIRVGWLTWYIPTLRRAFLAWHRHANGFVLEERDIPARVFVFTCTHFDRATRRCDSYASRPGMCRDYPRALLHQPRPELLPGCGYRPIARDAKRLLRVIDDQPMTDEQRAELKNRLFLE
jgi:Fe-S-cluster containining protein